MRNDTSTPPSATTLKQRKLYQVRHHPDGIVFGSQVGFKGRLLPLYAALRVAKRLRARGLFITCDPIVVKLTPAQIARLDSRY